MMLAAQPRGAISLLGKGNGGLDGLGRGSAAGSPSDSPRAGAPAHPSPMTALQMRSNAPRVRAPFEPNAPSPLGSGVPTVSGGGTATTSATAIVLLRRSESVPPRAALSPPRATNCSSPGCLPSPAGGKPPLMPMALIPQELRGELAPTAYGTRRASTDGLHAALRAAEGASRAGEAPSPLGSPRASSQRRAYQAQGCGDLRRQAEADLTDPPHTGDAGTHGILHSTSLTPITTAAAAAATAAAASSAASSDHSRELLGGLLSRLEELEKRVDANQRKATLAYPTPASAPACAAPNLAAAAGPRPSAGPAHDAGASGSGSAGLAEEAAEVAQEVRAAGAADMAVLEVVRWQLMRLETNASDVRAAAKATEGQAAIALAVGRNARAQCLADASTFASMSRDAKVLKEQLDKALAKPMAMAGAVAMPSPASAAAGVADKAAQDAQAVRAESQAKTEALAAVAAQIQALQVQADELKAQVSSRLAAAGSAQPQ